MGKKLEKKSEKKVTFRNYFLTLVVSVLVVAIAIYLRAFYVNYNSDLVQSSVFGDKLSEINFNELDYTLPESGNIILYVGYNGNKEIYNIEKRLLKEIEKKSLTEKVIYLNVSDYKKGEEYSSMLKKHFSNISNEITYAPMFIYVENGEAIEAMSSELKLVDYKVFNKLVEKYELE